MMGYSHTVSAATGWLVLHELGVTPPLDTASLVATTLACAGAGMLPDIDHKKGSIANSVPPLSQLVSAVVSRVSGGHRKGTHSLVGVVCFWLLAVVAEQLTYREIPWVSLVLAAYSGGIALRVLGAPGGWLGAVGLGYLAWQTDSLSILPLAVATGASIHIVGDFLTVRGINLFWPLSFKPVVASRFWRKSGYMALPLLGEAGSRREHCFSTLLIILGLWCLAAEFNLIESPLKFFFADSPQGCTGVVGRVAEIG